MRGLEDEFESIPEIRKDALARLAMYIGKEKSEGRPARLLFVCTHNSRRSLMGQVWAAASAAYFGVQDVETYSAGIIATAFNPRATAALKRAGFDIDEPRSRNPHYKVAYSPDLPHLECFSKVLEDESNPVRDFAAVMTCSDADERCPYIPGASERISLPYNDPKEADGTDEETDRYDERVREIGAEMLFAMSRVPVVEKPADD